jgi:hypothetical protein
MTYVDVVLIGLFVLLVSAFAMAPSLEVVLILVSAGRALTPDIVCACPLVKRGALIFLSSSSSSSSTRLLFVSARTNKRHHRHHLLQAPVPYRVTRCYPILYKPQVHT